MDRIITKHEVTVSQVNTTPLYLAPDVVLDPFWSIHIDPLGTLIAHYDEYANAYGGATMAVVSEEKYIKGVGPTPLVTDDSTTGFLDLNIASREALFTLTTHHCFADAPQLHAVLDTQDSHALVVKDMPLRLAHLEKTVATPAERMAACKAQYNLTNLSDDDFCDYMFYTIIERLSFWFFRRFSFGLLDYDSIDIFGNIVRHEKTQTHPDFSNRLLEDEATRQWDAIDDYSIVLHFMLDNLFEGGSFTNEAAASRYHYLISLITKQSAIQLLGLTRREINVLYDNAPELTLLLGQAIIDYLKQDDDAIANNFRDDFIRILKDMTTSTSKADAIASHYQQIGQYIPVRTPQWIENCRNANTDISRNVNIPLSSDHTAGVMASKIDLGQLIFKASIGKETS